MKAVRIHQHGGIDVLTIDDIEKPRITDNEILVQVKAASLNHLDLWVRNGIPGVPLPMIMGSDASGIIAEIGKNANSRYDFKIGDEVFIAPIRSCGKCKYCQSDHDNLCKEFQIPGESAQGVMAEFTAVDARYVLPKPKNLSLQQSAAFPLATLTAYHMLMRKTDISNAAWVLIYGASSGIGSAAISIAKHFGVKIITTIGSEDKREHAVKLGADYIINYKNESVGKTVKEITRGEGVDIVFEHPGALTWNESLKSLKIGGKIVTCGATTGPVVRIDLRALFIKHQSIIGSTMGTIKDMEKIVKLIEEGALIPVIDREFHYTKIKEAHNYLETGGHFGKIVINF